MKLSTFAFPSSIISSQLKHVPQTYFKPFSYEASSCWKRQVRCYRQCHRSGGSLERFNLAGLVLNLKLF